MGGGGGVDEEKKGRGVGVWGGGGGAQRSPSLFVSPAASPRGVLIEFIVFGSDIAAVTDRYQELELRGGRGGWRRGRTRSEPW